MSRANAFDEIPWADLKILRKVGTGGFGDVYAGMYGGTPVAIKRLRASGRGPTPLTPRTPSHTLNAGSMAATATVTVTASIADDGCEDGERRKNRRAPSFRAHAPPALSFGGTDDGAGMGGTVGTMGGGTVTLGPELGIAPEQQSAFLAEATSLSTVNHPNCLQLLGCCTEPQHLCIVTEYLKEGDLATLLFTSNAILGDAKKLSILRQIAQGCEYLHLRKDLIHRDLKPGNILLDHNASMVKVADFGLSVLVSKLQDERLRQGGTFKYMSPEQLLGDCTATKASDVFAFGVIAYEVLTRRRAFAEINRRENVFALPSLESMAPHSTLALLLHDLLKACLAPSASARPSFTEIVSELDSLRDKLVCGPVWPSVPALPPAFVPVQRDLNALRDIILRAHRRILSRVSPTGEITPVAGPDDAAAVATAASGSPDMGPDWEGAAGSGGSAGSSGGGVCIVGSVGLGKSVLAAALARDEAVRLAFPAGSHWITLGQSPAIPLLLAKLRNEMLDDETEDEARGGGGGSSESGSDDSSRGLTTEPLLSARQVRDELRELFSEPYRGASVRRALVILDDVTGGSHLAPFLEVAAGSGTFFVVITRTAGLGPKLRGWSEYTLSGLEPGAAISLLAKAAMRNEEALPDAAGTIARLCGYLPLSLGMLGGLLRHCEVDSEWDAVASHLLSLGGTADSAVQVAVLALGPLRYRYLDLAVFPPSMPITMSALEAMWSLLPEPLTPSDVKIVVDAFVAKALVVIDGSGDLILHELQREYVEARARESGSLTVMRDRLFSGLERDASPLRLQEIEFLQSMYCREGEFSMSPLAERAIEAYDAARAIGDPAATLDEVKFTVRFCVTVDPPPAPESAADGVSGPGEPDGTAAMGGDASESADGTSESASLALDGGGGESSDEEVMEPEEVPVEVEVDLVRGYPFFKHPVIAVRSPQLTRSSQRLIMGELRRYLCEATMMGDLCALRAVDWTFTHAPEYLYHSKAKASHSDPVVEIPRGDGGTTPHGSPSITPTVTPRMVNGGESSFVGVSMDFVNSTFDNGPGLVSPLSSASSRGGGGGGGIGGGGDSEYSVSNSASSTSWSVRSSGSALPAHAKQRSWLAFPRNHFKLVLPKAREAARAHSLTGFICAIPNESVIVYEGAASAVEAAISSFFASLNPFVVSLFTRVTNQRCVSKHSAPTWCRFVKFGNYGYASGSPRRRFLAMLKAAGMKQEFSEVTGIQL